jgi:threonine dehydrogenase-like Zn-dependent dehydrogenase
MMGGQLTCMRAQQWSAASRWLADTCLKVVTAIMLAELHGAHSLYCRCVRGFDVGWTGGQSEYHFVPYADFCLLRLPKDRAMSKMSAGLAFLSDIFPTGWDTQQ